MLRVGIVGIGFMGWMHYLAYQRVKGVKLTAICARDPRKLAGDWRGIQGNFGPRGEQVDLTHVGAYTEIEGLLHDPDVDLVDVCLPPDLHTDVTLRALAAGKHVLVEKPMALTAKDCDRMVAAAKKAIGVGEKVGQKSPAVVLVISDGATNAGRITPAQASEASRNAGIPVSTAVIGTTDGVVLRKVAGGYTERIQVPPDPTVLQQVAGATGGRFYRVTTPRALDGVTRRARHGERARNARHRACPAGADRRR